MKRTSHSNSAAIGLACMVLLAGTAAAQTIEPAGTVQAVAIDNHTPANVFAAGDDRVYLSTDGGRTWVESADLVSAWSLTERQDVVYAGTKDNGVMRSTDGGQTWTGDPGFVEEVRRVAVHPNDGSVWAGSGQALYRSHDRGVSWNVVANDLGDGHVHGIAMHRDNLNFVYIAKGNQGVYASTDGGQSWTLSNNGLTDTQVVDLDIDPRNPAVLYASTTSGIFQSVDAGASWLLMSGPTFVNELAISRAASSNLYVATENDGLYRTRDGGLTWQNATPNGVMAFASITTSIDGTEHVYAGSVDNGLFISDNSGVSWMTVSEFAGTTPRPVDPPSGDPNTATLSMNIIDLQNGSSVPSGRNAKFRITIRNEGPGPATDVAFKAFWSQLHIIGPGDPMPFTITAALGSCPTPRECFFGDLDAGAERTIEFKGETEKGSLTRYRLTARADASNISPFHQTAEISAKVTVVSSDGGGGSIGLVMLVTLLLVTAGRAAGRPVFTPPACTKAIRTRNVCQDRPCWSL